MAQIWHLLVSEAGSSGLEVEATTIAYFCLGDGPLPPSRGWRPAGDAESPAPVLRFATQADDGGFVGAGSRRGGREDNPAQAIEEERSDDDDAALFRAALPPAGVGGVVAEGAPASGTAVAAAGAPAEAGGVHGSNTSGGPAEATGRGRLKRRRKRQRPAEGIEDAVRAVGREPPVHGELGTPQGHQAKGVLVETGSVIEESDAEACGDGSGGVGGGRRPPGGCSNASPDDDRGAGCEGSNEAVAAFKAERWRLPEPSGELLARLERSRELLHRTIGVRLYFRGIALSGTNSSFGTVVVAGVISYYSMAGIARTRFRWRGGSVAE